MSDPKFTFPPWHATPLRLTGPSPGCDIGAENGANVALVHYDRLDDPPRTIVANAHLIAAAPELYAALDHVEAVLSIVQPRSHIAEYLETLAQVRAALAKAGGRS